MLLSIHQQQNPTPLEAAIQIERDLSTLLVDFITCVAKAQVTNFLAIADAIKQIDGFDCSDYAMSNSTIWVNFDTDNTCLTNQLTYSATAKIGVFVKRKAGAVYLTVLGLQQGKNGVIQTKLTQTKCVAEDKFDGYDADILEELCLNAGLNLAYSPTKYC